MTSMGVSAAEQQDAAAPLDELSAFVSAWPGMCKAMNRNAFSAPLYKPLIDAASSFESNVCACVEKRMRGDEYLGLIFTLPVAALRTRLDEKKLEPYYIGKVTGFW
ncbi:MAG: hypothetical protein KIT18_17380, partial [Burkholderiales bacterium]|nr:hypothetical protein [Burkholderiales bacterium]